MIMKNRTYRMEFWKGLNNIGPHDIEITDNGRCAYLERDTEMVYVPSQDFYRSGEYSEEVEEFWSKNPDLLNTPLPIINGIHEKGEKIDTATSTYKTSIWLKRNLGGYDFHTQEVLANNFPFLTVGVVTKTKDDRILVEQRRRDASSLWLTYPCGYVRRAEEDLSGTIRAQSMGELGFDLTEEPGSDIRSLGMIRESCEWTPVYTFLADTKKTFAEINPTKEVQHVGSLPADPTELMRSLQASFSPILFSEWDHSLIPNASGMLALYIRHVAGEDKFQELVDSFGFQSTYGVPNYGITDFDLMEYGEDDSPF